MAADGSDEAVGVTAESLIGSGGQVDPEIAQVGSVEELKQKGNAAFKKAQLLRKTTAGKQYLDDAKSHYAEACRRLSDEPATPETLELVCTLHANLAAVFLMATPPRYPEAKAAAEIALSVNPKQVKCLYRRAQALLEDGREGLPEESLQAAHTDLKSVLELEPANKQAAAEFARVGRRLAAIEEARRIPAQEEIVKKIAPTLVDRGANVLDTHGYVWGQTNTTVHLFLPARGVKMKLSKEITCEVKPSTLHIAMPSKASSGSSTKVHGDGTAPELFELTGALHKPVKPDECSWQLEDSGLVLHIELAKRDVDAEREHWLCVWASHPQTRAPSGEERTKVQEMAKAACMTEQKEPPPMPVGAQERLKGLRDKFPGMNIEWGDTSLDGLR